MTEAARYARLLARYDRVLFERDLLRRTVATLEEAVMAHKGQVGEQKGGSMAGKPTNMQTVKTVASGGKGKG
jgi:hypothetical protein